MTAQERATITPDDVLKMSSQDDLQREIHDGELIEMTPSGDLASEMGLEIGAIIRNYVHANRLGRVYGADGGFVLSDDPYVLYAPDAAFVARGNAKARTGKYLTQAPDLAVEVISPYDKAGEVLAKVMNYLRYGTSAVWVVYPTTRHVVVHQASGAVTLGVEDTLDGGTVLPGFSLAIRELFSVLDDDADSSEGE